MVWTPRPRQIAPNWPIELSQGVRANGTLMPPGWTKEARQEELFVVKKRTGGQKSVQWPAEERLLEHIVTPRQKRYCQPGCLAPTAV